MINKYTDFILTWKSTSSLRLNKLLHQKKGTPTPSPKPVRDRGSNTSNMVNKLRLKLEAQGKA